MRNMVWLHCTIKAGFTLIELAVVLAIIGLLSGGSLIMAGAFIENKQIEITEDKMAVIEDAIASYYMRKGYLPCPASREAAPDGSSYGVAMDCTDADDGTMTNTGARLGAVPVRTLGLASSYMNDGWGMRFSYVVSRNDAISVREFVRRDGGGVIVIDTGDNNVAHDTNGISSSDPTYLLPRYLLFSHGPDKKGAYPAAGGASPAVDCGGDYDHEEDTGNRSDENCEGSGGGTMDGTFLDAEFNLSTDEATYFDDIVRWKAIQSLPFNYRIRPFRGMQSGDPTHSEMTETAGTTTTLNLSADATLSNPQPINGLYIQDTTDTYAIDTQYNQVSMIEADWYNDGEDVAIIPNGDMFSMVKMRFSAIEHTNDPYCDYNYIEGETSVQGDGVAYSLLDEVTDLSKFYTDRIIPGIIDDDVLLELRCNNVQSVNFNLEVMDAAYVP